MKIIRHHAHPFNETLSELSQWFRDPLVDFEPFSRFLGHRFLNPESELPVDFYESDKHYTARFHLAGTNREDLSIHVEPNAELVVGFNNENTASRHIQLPDDADPDAVNAKLEDGVLTVTIGKRENAQPRAIEIH